MLQFLRICHNPNMSIGTLTATATGQHDCK